MTLTVDQMDLTSCHFCPLVIKPIEDVLIKATRISRTHPNCLSREMIVMAELLAIGVVDNFAAAHMARAAGGVHSFMLHTGFPQETADFAFWAIPGHDEGKVTKKFYREIAWDGRPIEGLPSADHANTRPASEVIDRTQMLPILFEHIKYAPLGTRVLHDCLNWPIDEILQLRLAIGPLHHLLGSGMPTLTIEPNKPHISEFVYHHDYLEDRELIETVAISIMSLGEKVQSIEELIKYSEVGQIELLATIAVITTLIDIVDALHRRPYLLNADPQPEDIERVLSNTRLPPFLISAGMQWYRDFGSTQAYYERTLTSGWRDLAAPILVAHARSHSPKEVCALTEMVGDFIAKIKPQAHINLWARDIVLPNMHYQAKDLP